MIDVKVYIVVAAMVCIAGLEAIALVTGVDGQIFSIVVGTIAGLAGYMLPSPLNKLEEK